ncbi:MAG: hypothetical protein RL585_298, partial [Pseudomonadota bacterium]
FYIKRQGAMLPMNVVIDRLLIGPKKIERI